MARVETSSETAVTHPAVRYLQDLLRIDTTNPPGNETAAAEYIAGVLRAERYDPVVVESSPGRGNVVARFAGTGELPPFLLYGHTDVVTAEPSHWEHGPFSGDVADGFIWGRGALDMKSLVAQQLALMVMLKRRGVPLRRDVIFAATADEEAGGRAGMGFLVDTHPDLVRAEYGLSEGGGTTMYIAGKAIYDIRTAEKGTCRFVLRTHGDPGHGSVPRPDTAVSRLAEAVVRLNATTLPFRTTATFARFYEILCELLGVRRDLRSLTGANLERVLASLPHGLALYLRAISRNTAVPTGLRAGTKINVIPSLAEAWVDGRYLPGQTPEGFLEEVRSVVGDGFEIERVDSSAPLEAAPGGPLYDTIVGVMGEVAPEARVAPMMLSGATDAKHVARLGTKCLGFGPVKISESFPAEQLVHGHNERIPVDGYLWGLDVLSEVALRFCAQ